MEKFKAFRIHKDGEKIRGRFDELTLDDLSAGEVVIESSFSGINYKDALAATGAGKILRKFPLVGGIDVAGTVIHSDDGRYSEGDSVVITGCGLSEEFDGGYSEIVRVKGDSVIPLPVGLSEQQAMILGTAGFTAALAIIRMEHNGLAPGGLPVVVTGATGGVGSLAVDMLTGAGYQVTAVTGKADSKAYLEELGTSEILHREQIDFGERPMEKAIWAGAIDNVGGEMLTWLTRTMSWWGSIASIGLVGGHELHTTVMPFILRGINILGINSMATPRELRLKVWQRLAGDLKPAHLGQICTRVIDFDELPGSFDEYLHGKATGRSIVKIR
ncbi:MAG: oxidoreductase [Gammaproteobacteria bacterium]|nr:oxidoreductase [Gammaproteobacteria bacterium]